MSAYHRPVLADQTIEALDIRPDGIYVDGTAGGGGHSFLIASQLTTGHLYALDQDPDAIAEAGKRLEGLPVTLIQTNFSAMREALSDCGVDRVDGVLLDIGTSSHQLDEPSRGFSYHFDAPLDMRMSQSGTSAADLVNSLSEQELARIFWEYGEEKFSRPIARAIVRAREKAPILTTLQLVDVLTAAIPAAARREKHPARKVFQSLRIATNRELDVLPVGLDAAFDLLDTDGRLAVITFHSLEDRIVKQRFTEWRVGCICPPESPVCTCGRTPAAEWTLRHPVEATAEELEENPRARSARLRCVKKLHERYR